MIVMHARHFRKHLKDDSVVAAIREAEKGTTGHIRVLISQKQVSDPVAAAQAEFVRMGLGKYPERNGVLIFVAPRNHRFAVIGDEGVHAKCGSEFWTQLAEAMGSHFRKHEFRQGVIHGISRAGELLASHFPKPSAH